MLENIAVILAIAYLLLAAKENILCWYCAFVSSLIYCFIFWDVSLLMESFLNIFYIVMAVVGWWQWRSKKVELGVEKNSSIQSLKIWQHVALITGVVLMAILNGWFMERYTNAVWPFVDSFTTWGSVVTTFLVVKKVLENWLYWIVIDGISIVLYIDRGLEKTALLFAAYVVIVIFGYFKWRKIWLAQQTKPYV